MAVAEAVQPAVDVTEFNKKLRQYRTYRLCGVVCLIALTNKQLCLFVKVINSEICIIQMIFCLQLK